MEKDRSRGIFWLGLAIQTIFVVLMGAVLYGCYEIMTEGLKIADPGTVAVIFTLIGTIIGYVAAQAQQVTNYYFGSSHGSAVKTEQMGPVKEPHGI